MRERSDVMRGALAFVASVPATRRPDADRAVVDGLSTLQRMPSTHRAHPDARNDDVLIYVDGEFVRRPDAKISVFDSAFLVGDGIWEGMRLHDGSIVFLNRHLDRLYAASEVTRIALPPRQELIDLLYRVCEVNGMTDGVHLRLMVSRGRKKTPSQHPENLESGPTIVIIAEYKRADTAGSPGVTLATSSVRRPPPETLDQRLNCHSKLHEVLALLEAQANGADEALMLNTDGYVSTCNATNFFMVRDGEVWTSTGRDCLPGITRGVVIELCRIASIPVHLADFTIDDVRAATEAFVTGTFGGVTPVLAIDGNTPGEVPGPVTRRLRALYLARVGTESLSG